jgi:hypothetical protein
MLNFSYLWYVSLSLGGILVLFLNIGGAVNNQLK